MTSLPAEDVRCPACARPVSPARPVDYRRQAEVLRALANPARLQIVDRLAAGPCTVTELTALVGLDQTTVSKHLATLRHQRLVEGTRRGSLVFYRLLTPCVTDFFACAAGVLEERP